LRQLTRSEYGATVGDLLGMSNPDTTAIPPDTQMRGFTNNVAVSFVDDQHLDAYSSVATTLAAKAITDSYAKLVPCATEDNACAASFIDNFGLHAFRRPLTDPEKARYLALFDPAVTGAQFKTGVQLVIRAMLISPSFLFRSELGKDDGKGNFVLTPYETASRSRTCSPAACPTLPCSPSAASGALANKAEIEAQARRLLADARGRLQVAHFFYEWLESPRAYVATKDSAAFPKLFTTPQTLDKIKGPCAKSKISSSRTSCSTRPSTSTSCSTPPTPSPTRSRQLLRTTVERWRDDAAGRLGRRFAARRLAHPGHVPVRPCAHFGFVTHSARSHDPRQPAVQRHSAASANVDTAIAPATPGNTTREQILAVTGNGVCPTCHKLQDPIGFGLEGFDGAGRGSHDGQRRAGRHHGRNQRHDRTHGRSAHLQRPTRAVDGGEQEPERARLLHHQLLPLCARLRRQGVDTCAVNKLKNELVTNDVAIPELFVKLATQDSFTQRRTADVVDP